MNASDYRLETLVDLEKLQSLADKFHAATDIPIGIVSLDNEVLVGAGWQRICTDFHRSHPVSCKNCQESDAFINSLSGVDDYVEYKCKNGMWDIAVPLKLRGHTLATLFMGQFFYDDETVDREFFTDQAVRYGFDRQDYLEALDSVPRYSRDKVRNIMGFYTDFGNLIVDLAARRVDALEANRTLESKVTERTSALNEERNTLFSLLDGLPAYVYLQAPDHTIRYANRYFRERFGDDLEQPCYTLLQGLDRPCEVCPTFEVLEDGNPRLWECDIAADGRAYQVYDYPYTDSDGNRLVLEMGIDISERRRYMDQLRKLATLDELTGVPNRRYLMAQLELEIQRVKRNQDHLALLMVDIDHFKSINDNLGHTAGDLVLRGVAQTLDEGMRGMDTVGRYGGEEFLVLMPETEDETAGHIAERLRKLIEERAYDSPNGPVRITVSIGVASASGAEKPEANRLIERADQAMYRSKQAGRNRVTRA